MAILRIAFDLPVMFLLQKPHHSLYEPHGMMFFSSLPQTEFGVMTAESRDALFIHFTTAGDAKHFYDQVYHGVKS